MKKILITGANSYIGTSFTKYMAQWPQEYQVDTIDMIDGSWRDTNFAGYDSVFHVAGIAHISTKKLDEQAKERYWKVNALLPVEVAQKAKAEGVCQFIFLSSMSVYGEIGRWKPPIIISKETQPAPKDIYGQSKFYAEEGICAFANDSFRTCILRPPMVYGSGAKGNYAKLVKLSKHISVFPMIENIRSMIHIERLCACLKEAVDSRRTGIIHPQDPVYSCTATMVLNLANKQGRQIRLSPMLGKAVQLLFYIPGGLGRMALKAFGSLVYAMDIDK